LILFAASAVESDAGKLNLLPFPANLVSLRHMCKIKLKHIIFMVILVTVQIPSLAIGKETNEPNYVDLFNKNLKELYSSY
jgi:hypothetical protein